MDIGAWERRASAFDGMTYAPDHDNQDEDEGYFDDTGEVMTHAEYEEVLFRRVIDKIRIARAAGNADVELSPEELDAYQSKLHGTKVPAARLQSQYRHSDASIVNDAASVMTSSRSGNAASGNSRAKKSQRTSFFGSKPKKEKPSSRKRTSTASSVSSHVPPGFVVPGPDGQPVYTPINAYQGNQARDPGHPSQSMSQSALHTSHQTPTPPRVTPAREILGAFPGSEHTYRPATPPRQGRQASSRQPSQGHEQPPVSRTRSSSIQSARFIPFPIEPYQYHTFSPSSSPTSPQPQYARRVSSGPSEASYTAMPRRVPISPAAPVQVQRAVPVAIVQDSQPDPTVTAQVFGSMAGATATVEAQEIDEVVRASGNAKDGERRRKGRTKKKS
ncbi:hypothetical protein BKA66DRAFT_429458 [Pyrenochaeta sp. MPI-SDFR-AT-0127]|nr:hypothetical protein BKA66DRAFT_429458 [Pyrenochaeta sp. MPI-SDFR-AT-0127]